MDTIEKLDGKYYFDGMGVDKEELLMWLILDELTKTLGASRIFLPSPLCWPACPLFPSQES